MQPARTLASRAFRMLPQDMALPILSGVNRGQRWIVGAGLIRCWLGTYETQEVKAFLDLVGPDDVVWDIGAHAGYFTLASAQRARQVIACEASAANALHLRRHLAINGIGNVTVIERAICDKDDELISFGGSASSYQGSIGGSGSTVRSATIDGLIANGLPAPTVIKMDIEGAETLALTGASGALARRPTIMLALHGPQLREQCIDILQKADYLIEDLNIGTVLARPSGADVSPPSKTETVNPAGKLSPRK